LLTGLIPHTSRPVVARTRVAASQLRRTGSPGQAGRRQRV